RLAPPAAPSLARAHDVAHRVRGAWRLATTRVLWSAALSRIYAVAPLAPVTYESYLARIHPEDRELVRERVARARASGKPFAYDHRIVVPDGRVRWVHGRGRVITDETGAAVRMVGTSQDITERRQ